MNAKALYAVAWILVIFVFLLGEPPTLEAAKACIVTNTADDGGGSLRQAIKDANARLCDQGQIAFNIGGGGPHMIAPRTPLPAILQPTIIDGTTQPGFNGLPVIELTGRIEEGAAIGKAVDGLTINSFCGVEVAGSLVRGLVINDFFTGAGIRVKGQCTRIEGNFIGADVAGGFGRGNLFDVAIEGEGDFSLNPA